MRSERTTKARRTALSRGFPSSRSAETILAAFCGRISFNPTAIAELKRKVVVVDSPEEVSAIVGDRAEVVFAVGIVFRREDVEISHQRQNLGGGCLSKRRCAGVWKCRRMSSCVPLALSRANRRLDARPRAKANKRDGHRLTKSPE